MLWKSWDLLEGNLGWGEVKCAFKKTAFCGIEFHCRFPCSSFSSISPLQQFHEFLPQWQRYSAAAAAAPKIVYQISACWSWSVKWRGFTRFMVATRFYMGWKTLLWSCSHVWSSLLHLPIYLYVHIPMHKHTYVVQGWTNMKYVCMVYGLNIQHLYLLIFHCVDFYTVNMLSVWCETEYICIWIWAFWFFCLQGRGIQSFPQTSQPRCLRQPLVVDISPSSCWSLKSERSKAGGGF